MDDKEGRKSESMIADVKGLIEEKAPASRKEREEEANRWERKLEVQLGRLAPEATQPDDLVALLAIAHMKRQSAELAKNRVFFDMRLQAMKAIDSGKTSTKDIDEAFSVVGRAPDSVKRVTEIVALVDEWLARHGRVEKARRDGTWNEAEVVALFKLKARTDRLMFEELKTLSDGLEAWVTGPGDKGGLAFAEEEEEAIKEKPVKEPR